MEELRRLRVAMDKLSAADRELLMLRHLQQVSVEEIAEAYHTSRTVITTRNLRALRRLRRILEADSREST